MSANDISARQLSAFSQQPKDHYPYTILQKITSTINTQSYLQDQKRDTVTVKEKLKEIKHPFLKRILIVDDEPDVALTFKPYFYDLMLVDVYMPHMNGFQLSEKILEVDPNLRVCFMSAAEININALREVYPKLSFGCFIKKPVTIECLVKRLLAELE